MQEGGRAEGRTGRQAQHNSRKARREGPLVKAALAQPTERAPAPC